MMQTAPGRDAEATRERRRGPGGNTPAWKAPITQATVARASRCPFPGLHGRIAYAGMSGALAPHVPGLGWDRSISSTPVGRWPRGSARHDWAVVPARARPNGWPQGPEAPSLRVALTTRHPIFVFWGPRAPLLLQRRLPAVARARRSIPAMLGAPVAGELFGRTVGHHRPADRLGDARRRARPGTRTTWSRATVMVCLDEVYWTYSYGPIDDEIRAGRRGRRAGGLHRDHPARSRSRMPRCARASAQLQRTQRRAGAARVRSRSPNAHPRAGAPGRGRRKPCASRRRSRPSANSPAASPTTSTTC
jgi:hypothetical protein